MIAKGTVVQILASSAGRPTVIRWSPSSYEEPAVVAGQKVLGVAMTDADQSDNIAIMKSGYLRDVSDGSESWSVGDVLYAGSNGVLTKTRPAAPFPQMIVGTVFEANGANWDLAIDVRVLPAIGELSGVSRETPASGDVFIYNNTTHVWEPRALDHNGDITGRSTATAHPASAITNTPAGTIASTDVQAALNELDTEKVPITRTISTTSPLTGGGELSGNLTLGLSVDAAAKDILYAGAAGAIKGNDGWTFDDSIGQAKLSAVITTPAPALITWTNMVGVSGAVGTLTKTAGSGWGNAGASSNVSFTGDGYVEWDASVDAIMFGLSSVDLNQNYTSNEFSCHTYPGNQHLYVYENGAQIFDNGVFTVGKKIRVARVGSQIKYYYDGALFYTSLVTPASSLLADAAIDVSGNQLQNPYLYIASSGAAINVGGLIIKGASAQSSNLQEWQNSSGTPLSYIDKDGTFNGTIDGGAP
jgi:predicted RecA/RadA family phage recombinase